jgi:hypothetical protein
VGSFGGHSWRAGWRSAARGGFYLVETPEGVADTPDRIRWTPRDLGPDSDGDGVYDSEGLAGVRWGQFWSRFEPTDPNNPDTDSDGPPGPRRIPLPPRPGSGPNHPARLLNSAHYRWGSASSPYARIAFP